MTPERWQQIDLLFHAALACEPPQRDSFLANACAGDEQLRQEVESLILFHQKAHTFIETPAADVAAELLGAHESTFAPGHQIDNYRIVRQLGSGGMGEVYLADDTRLNRKIALKLLPPEFTSNADRVRRFEREARAASALNHPNIVTIYEIGQSNSEHFMATEFIDGKTLRQMIGEKPFTLSEALNVVIQVAGALTGAHAAGIVHRDIKPENIMVRSDGYVKILDFGLAKLSELQPTDSELETPTLLQSNPGLVMGTVQYMSPEQARGKKVDARTDIWSLGVVLYELLAGRVPFSGETPSHVMVSLMEDELPPLTGCANVPVELDRIVIKALRKNQKGRYQKASQLARALKKLKQELQLEPRLKGTLESYPSSKEKKTKSDPSILVMTAQGTANKQLASDPSGNSFPSVTSDERYVVFVSDRTGFTNVWRMDSDGGNVKQLTTGEDDSWAWCSPDGQWVVYHSGVLGKRTLRRISIEGGNSEQLTDYPSVCPVVSPDGRWISCYYRPKTRAPWRLAIIPFEGGPPVKTFDVPQNVAFQSLVRWTPDGRALAYIMSRGGISNIWIQPLDGSPSKQVTDFKSDQIFWFDWSPDGRQLGVSRGAVTSDVVLIKDLR